MDPEGEEIEVEVFSCDIVFSNALIQCVHYDAVESVLDELKNLTFKELVVLGDYKRGDGMILKGDECIRFRFQYNEEMLFDYANVGIHNLLKKYGYLE